LRLLVDENLAPCLAEDLADLFRGIGLLACPGQAGRPTLLTGNCSTKEIERIVRLNAVRFTELERDARRAVLTLK
jgi:hypothetical protein